MLYLVVVAWFVFDHIIKMKQILFLSLIVVVVVVVRTVVVV